MFVGTQYFRPPNPQPADFDRDLALMREAGVTVAKTWIYWSKVNPRPGVWDFSIYDEFFDAAGRQGMKVLVQLMTESAPYWLEAQNPDLRYVRPDGRPFHLQSAPAISVGGFPGFCHHHPEAKSAVEEFIRRSAWHCQPRAEVESFDLWNEIWLPPCVCEQSEARFREYLEQRYGDLDALNAAYGGSQYTDFAQLRIPVEGFWGKKPVFPQQFDHFDFERERRRERLSWMADTVIAADPNRHLAAHGLSDGLEVDYDTWDLAGLVDRWGVSTYIGDFKGDSFNSGHLWRIALQFNTARDSSRGKPWWLAEHTGGSVWLGTGVARRDQSTTKSLLAFAFGAEASIYWQWRAEIFGEEAPNFGLTGREGERTPEVDRVAEITGMLTGHADVLEALTWAPPRVGMMWDRTSGYYARVLDDDILVRNYVGTHTALLAAGYDVQMLDAEQVAVDGVPEAIEIIFAPSQVFDRSGLSEALQAWVHGGGTLVAGPSFQSFGSDRFLKPISPSAPMDEVFGVLPGRIEYLEEPLLNGVLGERLVETYRENGAEVIARWEGQAAITSNSYGSGSAQMWGSFFGAPRSKDARDDLRRMVTETCISAGVEPPVDMTGGCVVRLAEAGDTVVAFVFNFSDQSTTCGLSIADTGLSARDLMSGDETLRAAGAPFAIELGGYGAAVLSIQRS